MARRVKEQVAEDPALTEKKAAVQALTDGFCDKWLNAEYKKLTRKLIAAMAKEKPSPLLRGKTEIWAAGIVHAIGGANFLFDKSFKPYISAADLASVFGVSASTVSQKAGTLRDRHPIDFPSTEFATKRLRDMIQNMMESLAESGLFLQADGFDVQMGVADGPTFLGDTFRLPPPRRTEQQHKEFLDDDRPAMNAFYDLTDLYERNRQSPVLRKKLEQLIAADPDFYDSYLMLADMLDGKDDEKAAALRETAFRRALARLPDKNGNWPESLPWGYLENRHLVRALLHGALQFWAAGDTDAALDLFRKLLKSNPGDNIGARHYILAIRLGQNLQEHEAQFETVGGFMDATKVWDWFDRESAKFPDEFAEWRKQVEAEDD